MKKYIIIFLALMNLYFSHSFAQNKIISYTVVENINMKFGGYTTTYNVSNLNLVRQFDLGPNNTRFITPIYKSVDDKKEPIVSKVAAELVPLNTIESVAVNAPIATAELDIKPIVSITKQDKYAYISMIDIYKNIAKKGYKSVDLFKKVGNAYYYEDELKFAAKWYTELFDLTEKVESEYLYRYSRSLRSIGDKNKADEMLEKYNEKSNN